MNPRQRRGVLLMIVAGIGAIAVFFTIVSYVGSLNRELGEYRTALRLTEDVTPYQPVTEDMVEEYQVPAKFFDEETFVSSLDEVLDQPDRQAVSSTYLAKGSVLQASMVIPAPELEAGEREIAIMVDAETGVAGKVSRQSRVDIYGTFAAGTEDAESCATRILTDVEVLEVGQVGSETDESGTQSAVVPVTFRLNPQDTLQLTYAEAFSSSLRLGLVSPQGSGDPGGLQFCSSDQTELEAQDDEEDDEEQAQDN
ncbi:pilus assembly protein CpaB [Lipingzhangella halophila]|uniref:Pilus assembly protein CpaB n=1 Tax=Lipingzhangella halophila TaxID=1783352 RepID=A0A7W7W1V9_9ACTN|nr:Flp pilus assembly protein CpaB [Lipingzhangella halophila]MBB4930149.1 pilus assembly protein CpaB [Lipingzhangella halophila]